MKAHKRLHILLPYAGLLPFLLCILLLYLDIQSLPWLGTVEAIFKAYGFMVAAFMTGIHWGQYLGLKQQYSINLFVVSNVVALLLWLSFLLLSFIGFALALIGFFLFFLYVDYSLYRQQCMQLRYFMMRMTVTLVVIACLVTVILMH